MSQTKGQVVLALLALGLDQTSKAWAVSQQLAVHNTGVAFSLFNSFAWHWLLIPLLIYVAYEWMQSKDKTLSLAWLFIFIGGASNLIDRFVLGYVRDFIYYPILEVKGNVADLYIVGGVGIILIVSLKNWEHQGKRSE